MRCKTCESPGKELLLQIDNRFVLSSHPPILGGIAEALDALGDANNRLYVAAATVLRPAKAMLPAGAASKLLAKLLKLLSEAAPAPGGRKQRSSATAARLFSKEDMGRVNPWVRKFPIMSNTQYSQSDAFVRFDRTLGAQDLSIVYVCCREGAPKRRVAVTPGQRARLQDTGRGVSISISWVLGGADVRVCVDTGGVGHIGHKPNNVEPIQAAMFSEEDFRGLTTVTFLNPDYNFSASTQVCYNILIGLQT